MWRRLCPGGAQKSGNKPHPHFGDFSGAHKSAGMMLPLFGCLGKSVILWIQHSDGPPVSHAGGGGQECGTTFPFTAAFYLLSVGW